MARKASPKTGTTANLGFEAKLKRNLSGLGYEV
jgi:hypothetical protein